MVPVLDTTMVILNVAYCLAPAFQIGCTNNYYAKAPSEPPRLSLISVSANLACSAIYLIYHLITLDHLSSAIAAFFQFILNFYILVQYCTYVPTGSQQHHTALGTVTYQEESLSHYVPMTSTLIPAKTETSDNLVFAIDDDTERRDNSFSAESTFIPIHAPVMAALLALSPVGSNAMPIGHPETYSTTNFADVLAMTIFLLLFAAKIAQLLQLIDRPHKKNIGVSQGYFIAEAVVLTAYLVLRITAKSSLMPFICLFKSMWAYTCLIVLNCAILMAISLSTQPSSPNEAEQNEQILLTNELKARLHSFHHSRHSSRHYSGHSTYGSTDGVANHGSTGSTGSTETEI